MDLTLSSLNDYTAKSVSRLFTAIYGLVTFSFVALVAYAATAGAFGSASEESSSMGASECEPQIAKLHDHLVAAMKSLTPYQMTDFLSGTPEVNNLDLP